MGYVRIIIFWLLSWKLLRNTWITPGYSQPPVRLIPTVLPLRLSTLFLRNCYPNYLEDIVLTFNNIRKRFRSQKSEYRKNLLRRTILCMQNSTVSTHYGPCATPKCVTPKGVSNKTWLEDITRFIWRRTRRRFLSPQQTLKVKSIVIIVQSLSLAEKCSNYQHGPYWFLQRSAKVLSQNTKDIERKILIGKRLTLDKSLITVYCIQ